nr:branched-chain amino acid transport system II carrier protein [Dolosigranulum pigrum]
MRGFTEGYQTMDALGAPLMAGIVVADFIRRGYQETTERYEMVKKLG